MSSSQSASPLRRSPTSTSSPSTEAMHTAHTAGFGSDSMRASLEVGPRSQTPTTEWRRAGTQSVSKSMEGCCTSSHEVAGAAFLLFGRRSRWNFHTTCWSCTKLETDTGADPTSRGTQLAR